MFKWLVFALYLIVISSSLCYCQKLVYYCNFDRGLIDDCMFKNQSMKTSIITVVSGVISNSLKTIQPLSDVTSIKSLTLPNNEMCILPYLTDENKIMHFCNRNTKTNFTCPTPSGIGNCIIGNYALFKTAVGTHDETYFTNINTESNTVYCLDFFYYMTSYFIGAKLTVGWKSNDTTKIIVEVKSFSENKWQQSQTTFISPEQKLDQIWFRISANNIEHVKSFIYAIDEIKIYEGSCESGSSQIKSLFALVRTEDHEDNTNDISTESTSIESTTITDTTTTTVATDTSTIITTTTTTSTDTTTTTTVTDTTTETTEPTTSIETTEEDMNITTAYTSDTNLTTYTIPPYGPTKSAEKERELYLMTLTVPLGMGIPALLIVIGGLFYHYRKAQRRGRASTESNNVFGIEMAETDA